MLLVALSRSAKSTRCADSLLFESSCALSIGPQLQLGDETTNRLSPVRIEGYGADTAMRLPSGDANALTMFVLAADGTAMGSGRNFRGMLGNGGTNNVLTAGAIPELGGGIVEIARGRYHTLVLKGE